MSEPTPSESRLHPNAWLAEHTDFRAFYCAYCDAAVAKEAAKTIKATFCAYREGCALLFTGAQNIKKLSKLVADKQCHAGICGPFARALSGYGCAEKAYTAFKMGDAGLVSAYADVRFWAFVEHAETILTDANLTAQDFCHRSVFDLLSYDRLQNTEYRISLMAYVRAGCDARAAAAMIGVHRNTMAYRIKRMEALFGICLHDAGTCFELLFSFTALEAAGIDWDAWQPLDSGIWDREIAETVLWTVSEQRTPATWPDFTCRLVMTDTSDLSQEEAARVFCALTKRYPDAALAYRENYIAILSAEEPDDLATVLASHGCCGVVSQSFACNRLLFQIELLTDILKTVKQLYPDQALLRAADFCSLTFFTYLQKRTSLDMYCCDEIIRIMDYDYRKGTEFAQRFYLYLASFQNVINAAQAANMHRNTLEYQIKKAMSLAGVQEVDDHLRFEMICTYKILLSQDN